MAFHQDQGTWCLFIPLKIGVGISCCLVFVHGIVGALALVSDDVRFQPNGYNPQVNKLPSVVNSVGVLIGFIGLVGMFDDHQLYMWIFNRYCAVRIITMLATAVLDYMALGQCDTWIAVPHHASQPRLDVLSKLGVCKWARWSLVIGATVELGFWTYLLIRSYVYERLIAMHLPYKIDFGSEKDVKSKWAMYQVGKPSAIYKEEEDDTKFYGSTAPEQGFYSQYGHMVATRQPRQQPRPEPAEGRTQTDAGAHRPAAECC